LKKFERIYPIRPSFDIAKLARALDRHLQSEGGMECEVLPDDDGWIVQARQSGNIISRIVKRKAESLYAALIPHEKQLIVQVSSENYFSQKTDKTPFKKEQKFSLRNAASYAKDTVGDLAETVTAGVSDLWLESITISSLFDFVSGKIVEDLREGLNSIRTGINPSLSRYVEGISDIERAWLAGFREPGEILLAHLHTVTPASGKGEKAQWRFIFTNLRSALAAFSEKQFIGFRELPDAPMSVTDMIGKDKVNIGDVTFHTRISNDMLFQEIAPLTQVHGIYRIIEAARLHYIRRKENTHYLEYASTLMTYAQGISDDPRCELTCFYLKRKRKSPDNDVFDAPDISFEFKELKRKLASRMKGKEMQEWAEGWELSIRDRIFLAEQMQGLVPEYPTVAHCLHHLLADAREKTKKDHMLNILAEIRYAQNLKSLDRSTEAMEILEKHLHSLPDESLSDLLPAMNTDLTKGEGGQILRVKILEAQAEIQGDRKSNHCNILRALAILQPLVPDRLNKLAELCEGRICEQAHQVLKLLKGGGLSPGDTPSNPNRKIDPASPADLERHIRHPAAREGTVLRKVQNFLAANHAPDHSALKSYAKQVDSKTYPGISDALSEAVMMLGMKAVQAFISSGESNTGIRSYDGSPAFLLIGSEHLESDSPNFMTSNELRFVIGSELAHIRFGHERISSRDVWEGTFDKAMSVAALIPLLGGYIGKFGSLGKIAGQAGQISQKIGSVRDYISKGRDLSESAWGLFQQHSGKGPAALEADEDNTEERDLIRAFRVMQLTADRSGLLLCRDLHSAIRALFITDPKLNHELPVVQRYGLDSFLSRTDEKGNLLFHNTAIRIAALFSFYLSEDYDIMISKLYGD